MRNRKVQTRLAVAALAIGLAMSTLTPAYATQTITIWTYGDVIDTDLVHTYEASHPGIRINAINQGSPAAVKQKFQLYKTSKSVADVIVYETDDSGYFRHYGGSLFKNLKNYPGEASLSQYYLPWRWNQGVAENGNVIGLPTDVGGMAVAYRTDLFKAAKLPTAPAAVAAQWSGTNNVVAWSNFVKVGKKFMSAPATKNNKKIKGFIDSSGTIFKAALNQGTKKFYSGSQADLTNSQLKTAFTIATNAATATPTIGARINPYGGSDWTPGLSNGAFAVTLAPAWQLDYIIHRAPASRGKWNITSAPGNGGNVGGSQLAIPSFAQHASQAWDFISWYESPYEQLQMFKKRRLFPTASVLYDKSKTCVGVSTGSGASRTPALSASDCGYILKFKDPFFNNAAVGSIYAKSALSLYSIPSGPLERAFTDAYQNQIARVEAKKAKFTPGSHDSKDAWNKAVSDSMVILRRG